MSKRIKPLQVALSYIEKGEDQDGFILKYINDFIGLF